MGRLMDLFFFLFHVIARDGRLFREVVDHDTRILFSRQWIFFPFFFFFRGWLIEASKMKRGEKLNREEV